MARPVIISSAGSILREMDCLWWPQVLDFVGRAPGECCRHCCWGQGQIAPVARGQGNAGVPALRLPLTAFDVEAVRGRGQATAAALRDTEEGGLGTQGEAVV